MKKEEVLLESINECQRFIKKAKEAIKRLEGDEYAKYGSKEMASAKRSSMDVTRIMVEVRKPY